MPLKDKAAYNAHMKQYMAKRYHRRRAEAIEQLGGRCAVCGTATDLNFDHVVASEKGFNIGTRLAGIAETKLQEELAKCQLLCEPCHKQKSAECGDNSMKGEANPISKLNEAQVLEARRRYRPRSETDGAAAIAREFGVSRHTVRLAIQRKTWKHI